MDVHSERGARRREAGAPRAIRRESVARAPARPGLPAGAMEDSLSHGLLSASTDSGVTPDMVDQSNKRFAMNPSIYRFYYLRQSARPARLPPPPAAVHSRTPGGAPRPFEYASGRARIRRTYLGTRLHTRRTDSAGLEVSPPGDRAGPGVRARAAGAGRPARGRSLRIKAVGAGDGWSVFTPCPRWRRCRRWPAPRCSRGGPRRTWAPPAPRPRRPAPRVLVPRCDRARTAGPPPSATTTSTLCPSLIRRLCVGSLDHIIRKCFRGIYYPGQTEDLPGVGGGSSVGRAQLRATPLLRAYIQGSLNLSSILWMKKPGGPMTRKGCLRAGERSCSRGRGRRRSSPRRRR